MTHPFHPFVSDISRILKPGDTFVCQTTVVLWDDRQGKTVTERIPPNSLCLVIARQDNDYLVLPPSGRFGWAYVARLGW